VGEKCYQKKCVEDLFWQDPVTDLTWENQGSTTAYFLPDAIAYCQNLSLLGFDDWRLPDIDEARTLIRDCAGTQKSGSCQVSESCPDCYSDNCCNCGDGCHFPPELGEKDCASVGAYWTTTFNKDGLYWIVHFGDACLMQGNYQQHLARAKCVR